VLAIGYVWSWSAALEVRPRPHPWRSAARHARSKSSPARTRRDARRATRDAQRRPNTPIRPIFSEIMAKHALVDRAAGGTPKVY